jgi:hypothetical protein
VVTHALLARTRPSRDLGASRDAPQETALNKTSLTLVGIASVVALVAILIVGGKSTQARETVPQQSPVGGVGQATNPTSVFECFQVDPVKGQTAADPKAVVRLVTQNFGAKLVRVRKLVAMCELANKFPPPVPGLPDEVFPPDPATTRIFACYQIDRGNDPNDPYVLTTNNFGKDVVRVRVSKLMCEEASKTRITAAGTITVGNPTGQIWQCFNLNNSKNNNGNFRLVTNNFGRDGALVLRGTQLCEEAMKQRLNADGTVVTSGDATGRVLECFRLESPLDPKANVTLTIRNFGNVEVTVRRAQTMCEPATKTPIFTFPDDNDDIPGDAS